MGSLFSKPKVPAPIIVVDSSVSEKKYKEILVAIRERKRLPTGVSVDVIA